MNPTRRPSCGVAAELVRGTFPRAAGFLTLLALLTTATIADPPLSGTILDGGTEPLQAPRNDLGRPAPTPTIGAAGELIGFSSIDASGTQTITLVHAGKSWMAVYHIDKSGTIRLVSSRPIDADFSLQLNATSPLPQEIRQISGGAK